MDDLKWLVLEAYRQKWLTGEQLKTLQKMVGLTETSLQEKLKEFGIHDEQLKILAQQRSTKHARTSVPKIASIEEKNPTHLEKDNSQIPTHASSIEEYLENIAGVKQATGTFLDQRYELKEFLGEGGMGEVYKGYDQKLGRSVALKFLKLGSLDQKQRERFFKEARALGKLNHPHIVQVYDMGEFKSGDRSKFYVVMELVEGKNLAEQLKGQPMNPRLAAELTKKIASALVHVHEHHLIHLDIKPSNIMMFGEEPKLMDFGLAKQIGAEVSMSRVGGTPQYMSPEQCDEAQYSGIGEQTDVYLLGGTLYELLTGKAPFSGSSEGEILRKVLHEEPKRICVLHKEVHPDLEAICLKALEKKKTSRYATAKEFLEELENFLNYRTIKARRPTPWTYTKKWFLRNKKLGILALLTVLTIIAEIGYVFLQERWHEEEKIRQLEEQYQNYLKKARTRYESAMNIQGDEREERGQRMQELMLGFKNIMSALLVKKVEKEAEEQKIVIGNKLLQESLSSQDYELAYFIAEELQSISYLSEAEKSKWFLQVQEEKTRVFKEHLSQLEEWFAKAKPNSSKEWKRLENEEIEDFIYDVSKMPEEGVYKRILQEFNTNAKVMIETPVEKRSINDDEYNHILVKILGRMERKTGAKDIFETLQKMVSKSLETYSWQAIPETELEYMIELFRALGRLKAEIYGRELEQIRSNMGGTNSLFGIRTSSIAKKFLAENIRHYTHEIENNPQEIQPYISRGETKYTQEDWAGAIQDYTEALTLLKKQTTPDSNLLYSTYNARGLARWKAEDFTNAIQDFTEAIALSPEEGSLYNNRGLIKYTLNDYPGAIADYSKAIECNSSTPVFYNNRGLAKMEQLDLEGAIADYSEAISLNPQSPDSYYFRGQVQQLHENYEEAIQDFSVAIRLNPEDERYYYSRGEAKYSKNDLVGALDDLTSAIRINSQYTEAYYKRGMTKYYREEYESALVDFNEAIRLNPEDGDYYNWRGILKNYLGKTEEALEDYNTAIHLNPESSENYYNRAMLKKEIEEAPGALMDLNEAIRLSPEWAEAYFRRSLLKVDQNELEAAEADFKEAIRFDPEEVENYKLAWIETLSNHLKQQREERQQEPFNATLEILKKYVPADDPQLLELEQPWKD